MFEHASWQPDRMILDGLVFRIEHHRSDDWDGGDGYFRFYKTKALVDEYESFFRRQATSADNVFELGLWDGGSLAFWCEGLRPKKIVGVDIEDRQDSAYFRRYVEERRLGDRVKTYWRTNQADRAALLGIVRDDFDGPLDVVFDDASHLYGPTKASFETLFPLLRPGGLYVIEDWAWNHWREFQRPKSWSPGQHLTRLVVEAVEAAGTNRGVVAGVTVAPGFVCIERGSAPAPSAFRLDEHIYHRSDSPWSRVVTRVMWGPEREALSKVKQRILGMRR